MYKNRHFEGNEKTKGWGQWVCQQILYASMHFVHIKTKQAEHKAVIIAAMLLLLKLCLLELCDTERLSKGNERSQLGGSVQQAWTAVLPPCSSYCYSFVDPCTLQVSVRSIGSSAVKQGPSSLFEQQARVHKHDSTGLNNIQ